MRSLSLLLLLSLASTCEAAAVFRCEDASGHVSFTQLGCPAGQAGETVVADNPPPGGRSVTPMAETKTKKASIGRKNVPLAVIGEREDRCGRRLDEKERRKAIVEQRIMTGMTRSDVERALGKPDRVSGKQCGGALSVQGRQATGSEKRELRSGGMREGKGKVPGGASRSRELRPGRPHTDESRTGIAFSVPGRVSPCPHGKDGRQSSAAYRLPAAHASGWRLWSGSILFLRFAGQQRA